MSEIIIKDPKIIDFYSHNKHLDIEYINVAFIDFYEKFIVNQEDITKNVANEILSSIHSLQQGIETKVLSKFYEIKQGYTDDLKIILEQHANGNLIKIMEKIEKDNQHILEKTHQMIQTIVPASQSQFQVEHERSIRTFKEEVTKLLDTVKSDVSMDKIHTILSREYNQLLTNVQQHVLNYVSTSETRLQCNITEIKDIASSNRTHQEKLNTELTTFLSQYKVSQKKGEFGENLLNQILCSLFPSSEIINTTGQTSAGDYIVKRPGKPIILFENKHFNSGNVPKKDVDKFIFDVEQQNCSGIMMAQTSGIALKNNFEIDIHRGNVLVYIHRMNYEPEKILVACDIIDHLSEKIKDHTDNHTSISHEVLQTINQQYQSFLEKRDRIIVQLNNNHKKTVSDIKDLTMNELNLTLSSMFASTSNRKERTVPSVLPPLLPQGSESVDPSMNMDVHAYSSGRPNGVQMNMVVDTVMHTCPICHTYTTNNARSLSGHTPQCKKKHTPNVV